jgi:hypothetical protein
MQLINSQKNTSSVAPISGVELGGHYFLVKQDLTASQIEEMQRYFLLMERSINWQLGDFLNYVTRHQLMGKKKAMALAAQFTNPRSVYEAMFVTATISIGERETQSASYNHHLKALQETGEKGVALEWVRRAAKEKLTVQEMVRAIRDQQAEKDGGDEKDDGAVAAPITAEILQLANRCRRFDRSRLDRSAQLRLKNELEPVVELYNQLGT